MEKERTRRTRRVSERDAVYFELLMDCNTLQYNCEVGGTKQSVLAIVIQMKFNLFNS